MNRSRSLGEFLCERKVLSRDALEEYLAKEATTGRNLAALLVADGLVGERDLIAAIAEQTGQRFIDLDVQMIRPGVDQVVPEEIARELLAVAVDIEGAELIVAMADPSDKEAVAKIAHATGWPIVPALAVRASLTQLIVAMYGPMPGHEPGSGAEPASLQEAADEAAGIKVTEVKVGEELHINDLLLRTLELGGSDLHLTVGVHPTCRVDGDLVRMEEYPVMNGSEVRRMIYGVLTQKQRERFEGELELDMSHAVPGKGRFRVNVFFQRDSMGAVCRAIPVDLLPLEQLGLPAAVGRFAELPRGLVLVTGPTGSGKSTTLASLIDIINRTRQMHIMTVEDPIEFLHSHKAATVNQREVGEDTHSFANALKHVLRQDPDVILVGEMRDLETIQTALTAAETGHLVFATLHTQDAPQSIDRIIDVFPAHQQQQIRVQVASSLQGVVTQQLVPTTTGKGRVCIAEVLVATPAIRNLIREGKTHQIHSAMQAGGAYGMTTMDQTLAEMVRMHRISMKVAIERSSNVEDMRRLAGEA
jgi:twitching motility protein PilT